MVEDWQLLLIILGYLSLLFIIAYYAENRERRGHSLVTNPYVYSLSLAVYCTSWTFYGSVGKAATSGLAFLPIYLGPTLMAILWGSLLLKIITIAKRHRITTISDFIGSRYGNSLLLSALVTIVAVVGITPYLGLQMKAIMNTFTIMAGEPRSSMAAGWLITFVLGIFAIIFGARRLDSSERHEGLIFAVAFESMIKLVAFLAVGIFVTYGVFTGFDDILTRIEQSPHRYLLTIGDSQSTSYQEWASLLLLSMAAILFLPRQFHVAVVENSHTGHLRKAMWLFPLYMLLINVFVLPIAYGGILLGSNQAEADSFVLTIPLSQQQPLLALLVFIGGFSAATGMIIVESLALSTMMMNSLVMPALLRFKPNHDFPAQLLNIKRFLIFCCVFLGYAFAIFIGRFYTLVEIGLKSFEAVTIFAPALILGLYWKKGNRNGAVAGIVAGFAVWCYTLVLPSLVRAEVIAKSDFLDFLSHYPLLDPRALFGLSGLDEWSHSLFWELFCNLVAYVGVSLFTTPRPEDEAQGLLFVESYNPQLMAKKNPHSLHEIEDILGQYIGRPEAREVLDRIIDDLEVDRQYLGQAELLRIRSEAERVLSGVLGSSIATIIFEEKRVLTEFERGELSAAIKQITDTLRLSRHDLAEANRNLAYLKEFSENIIESVPLGIVTLDARGVVRYWNTEMENLAAIKRQEAINRPIRHLLPWIPTSAWTAGDHPEIMVQSPSGLTIKLNIVPFEDPSGGLVVILENVTEKKKMEEQLLQSSKLASLGKFTAGISHEIGNPLASISSLIQELQSIDLRDPKEDYFTREALTTVNKHVTRIAKIVRGLSDFARISATERTATDIIALLQQTVDLVKFDKRSRAIDFLLRAEAVPLLEVNPDQIQQVFFNLLINAVDAMPEGGQLEMGVSLAPPWVLLTFADTGSGIDEAIMDRIFDPFFTTKPHSKGTGLGLSLCYGIIRDHHGQISANSQKGRGTVFEVRLPMQVNDE